MTTALPIHAMNIHLIYAVSLCLMKDMRVRQYSLICRVLYYDKSVSLTARLTVHGPLGFTRRTPTGLCQNDLRELSYPPVKTAWSQLETQAAIMQSSLVDSSILSDFSFFVVIYYRVSLFKIGTINFRVNLYREHREGTGCAEWQMVRKNLQFSANKSPYLRNGAS